MEHEGDLAFDCAPRVGCDLAEVEAVAAAVAAFGERYLDRVYSAAERAQTAEAPERLAARFAGKEAVLKLLRVDGLHPRLVEIVNDAAGVPAVRLSAAAQASAHSQGIGEIAVSLSHEGGLALATAFALAVRPAVGPDPSVRTSSTPRGNE